MLAYPTEAWTDTSLALYDPGAAGNPWLRADNVMLRARPALAAGGTVCTG
jgi:hypothetical protein